MTVGRLLAQDADEPDAAARDAVPATVQEVLLALGECPGGGHRAIRVRCILSPL